MALVYKPGLLLCLVLPNKTSLDLPKENGKKQSGPEQAKYEYKNKEEAEPHKEGKNQTTQILLLLRRINQFDCQTKKSLEYGKNRNNCKK